MSFDQIYSQQRVLKALFCAFRENKIPHAYIFAGSEGVGKFSTAREYARLLLCNKPNSEGNKLESCGKCESCRCFDGGSHPDFQHVHKELIQYTKEGKNKKTPVALPIDVIREFLIEKVSAKPSLSERKIFVVSQAEKLNNASQNALLKVLEEPPYYCVIILLCTRLENLLATTKSRCQILRFGPVDQDIIANQLARDGFDKSQAGFFARLSQGSLGTAKTLGKLEKAGANFYETKQKLVKSLARYKYPDSLRFANWLIDQTKNLAKLWTEQEPQISKSDITRRSQKMFIRVIISAFQDAMNISLGRNKLANADQKEEIKRLAEKFGAEQSAIKIEKAYKSMRMIEASVNEKLLFEDLLLNLAVFGKVKD